MLRCRGPSASDKRYNLDIRVDSTNLLNHVVYSSWNTTLNPIINPGPDSVFTPN